MNSHDGRRSQLVGWLFVSPSAIGLGAFMLFPALAVLWLSTQDWDLIGPSRFVGLGNWRAVLTDPQFGHSLLVTIGFTAVVVPAQTALGLWVATLLTKGLRGSSVFRTVLAVPWVCAPLALALIWKWLLSPADGAINALTGSHAEWLTDPKLAFPAVAAVSVWSQTGYVALFFVAGLYAIPEELGQAACLDGASSRQRFWRITLPLLRPTLVFVSLTGVINAVQVFDLVYGLTRGGPNGSTDLVAHRLYSEAFEVARPGRAAVMAVVLALGLMLIAVATRRVAESRAAYALR
nr:sugar ABC transporter permease [Segniliparus rotundus]